MFYQKKIVIAGGSGFIGQAMAKRWAADNEVIILTRDLKKNSGNTYGVELVQNVQYVQWDAKSLGSWTSTLKNADLLINLSEKSVNCRYTSKNRKAILNSRLVSTQVLGEAVRACTRPPKLWINAASATIYRDARDRPQDETTGEMHDDFSVQVCKMWEATFLNQCTPYTRKVALRTAIVLGEGGVLVPFKRLVLAGLGGQQGDGKQMFSWIHRDDLCRMAEWIYDHPEQEGIYNASAPNPVSNEVFMRRMREAMGATFGLPAPAWLLRLGAYLIGTETELILKSRWVLPGRILREGFRFKYPEIESALRDLLEIEAEKNPIIHALR
jgi:uncharacterized protein (TIGR01777 family)